MRLKTGMILLLAGLTAAASPAIAETGPMSGKEIRQAVTGNRIYLQTPFGGEFPLFYRTDGVVDGSGKALGLGRFMAPTDSGKWWIKGDRLCQQWSEWYEGRQQCFELRRTGEASLYWKRDDGLEGEARIGQ